MKLDVSPAALADLRARLRATRWAAPWPDQPDEPDQPDAGVAPDRLRALVGHWADGYDWRRHEAELAELPPPRRPRVHRDRAVAAGLRPLPAASATAPGPADPRAVAPVDARRARLRPLRRARR
jgi:Epoxide hydrolase N terminus